MIHETLVNHSYQLQKTFDVLSFVKDNAWMETEAANMHDETGELTKYLKLEAGKYFVLKTLRFQLIEHRDDLRRNSHRSIIERLTNYCSFLKSIRNIKYFNKAI